MPPRRRPGLNSDAATRIGRRAPAEGASSGSTATATAEAPPARSGILGAISAAAEQPPAPGERIVDVDVAQLAPHPDNIRESVGDVAGLGESIAERGVLQPLVVVSRAAFATTRPDVELAAAARYVIVAGHRRHAGAVHAGVATVPVVVRDALAGDEDVVLSMIVENVQRTDLSPIEQARAFGRLRDRGWSERRIAKETGVSPGQVHKRLQLLRLPAKLAAALDGELTVADALRLLELPDDEITSAWSQAKREDWRGVNGVVTARLAAIAARARAQQLRAALTAADVRIIDDLDTEFGRRPWEHLDVHAEYTIPGADPTVHGIASGDDAVPPPATALAYITTQGERLHLAWYSTERHEDDPPHAGGAAAPGPGASGGSTDTAATAPPVDTAAAEERARQLRERQERAAAARAAAEARSAACARIVTGRLEPELAVEILADALLVETVVEPYEYTAVAAEMCGLPIDEDDVDDSDDPIATWLRRQAASGPLSARRAGVAVALAEVESSLSWTGGDLTRPWTAHEARHVMRLAAHGGYELTPDDEQQLAAAHASTPATDGATS